MAPVRHGSDLHSVDGRLSCALGLTLVLLTIGLAWVSAISSGESGVPANGCAGDCDRDGTVTVDEVLRGVAITLGAAPIETCAAFDMNGDAAVTIDELLRGIGAALNGCATAAAPTPTPATCPAARALIVGRNSSGFGRLQDGDRLRVINFLQAGATVRFNVEARCVNADAPATLHARLETTTRLLFDMQQTIVLDARADGLARRLAVVFPVLGPGPFYEFEGAEAQLNLTLTDSAGVTVSEHLHLTLTFNQLPDLPDPGESHAAR